MNKKMRTGGWTRRRVLASAAGGMALAATAGLSMPAIAQPRKLTYWGGLVLSDTAHKLLIHAVTAWGATNMVETEVVLKNVRINVIFRLAAAILPCPRISAIPKRPYSPI